MERLIKILNKLGQTKGYISIDDLAKELHVTARSIRSDLIELEALLKDTKIQLVRQRGRGVSVDKQKISEEEYLQEIQKLGKQKDFYSSEERERLILETLLLSDKPVTYNSLEELTIASRSSIIKSLQVCEKRLETWQISIEKKTRSGISLVYEEKQWRLVVLTHIMQYVKRMDFQQLYKNLRSGSSGHTTLLFHDFIRNFMNHINTFYILNFINRYELSNKTKFTDDTYVSVFFWVCIAIQRVRSGHELKSSSYKLNQFFELKKIEKWVGSVIDFLNQGLDIELNYYEQESILIYMLSQKQTLVHGSVTENSLLIEDTFFHQKTTEIARRFIRASEQYLNVDLISDEGLFENLLLHIRPAIFRILFNIKIENPLLEDIRLNYPAIFTACREAAKILETETDCIVDDNEVSYLALHIGASIEKIKDHTLRGVYKIIIVCPSGKGTSNILYYRLLNSIPNLSIEIVCSMDELELVNKEDIDIIISTLPIFIGKNYNIINVNPLLTDKDIQKIYRAMKRIDLTREMHKSLVVEDMMSLISKHATIYDYETLYQKIDQYFQKTPVSVSGKHKTLDAFLKPQLISLQASAYTWQEAFQMAGNLLFKESYIQKRYIDSMIRNAEMYGDYMIISNGVAFPHAKPTDGVYKTGMAFLTLREPVLFQYKDKSHYIQLIIAMSADDSMGHLTAMKEIFEFIERKDQVNCLLDFTNKNEFMNYLKAKRQN